MTGLAEPRYRTPHIHARGVVEPKQAPLAASQPHGARVPGRSVGGFFAGVSLVKPEGPTFAQST